MQSLKKNGPLTICMSCRNDIDLSCCCAVVGQTIGIGLDGESSTAPVLSGLLSFHGRLQSLNAGLPLSVGDYEVSMRDYGVFMGDYLLESQWGTISVGDY